jgi:hypothetical protein
MFASKTVFVVGAGASKEAGLPVGAELKQIIASKLKFEYRYGYELLRGDPELAEVLTNYAQQNRQDPNLYFQEARKIAEAMPQAFSIDTFIDAHRGNIALELCGKLAISHSILEAENSSKLYFNLFEQQNFQPEKLSNTWYENFFQLLTESVRVEDLEKIFDSVSFVVFNYDRCIEHFLYHSLKNYYRIDEIDTINLLERLKISHPYGLVGPLMSPDPRTVVTFGARHRGINLREIAGQIKTFTERVEDEAARDGSAHRSKRLIRLSF